MKKIFQTYHWIVFLFISLLSSCTNDIDDRMQLLKQIVEVNVDGSSSTTVLSYNGNKISSIDNNVTRFNFFYTANLITKTEEINKVSDHVITLQFDYTNDELVKISSSENYVINYVHNADGSVSYEKLAKGSNNNDVKVFHGNLYFKNTNLVKDKMILDKVEGNVLNTKTISFDYDYKINALHNVIGFNKLLNFNKSISLNNNILMTEEFEVENIDTNQVISSIKQYKNDYTYNSVGYPTEIVSEKLFLGNGASLTHSKTILYYD